MERRICRMSDLYINNEFHRGYITATLYRCTCPIITAPPNLPKNWPVPAPDPEKRAWMSGGDPNAFVLMLHGGYAQIRMTPQLVEALSLLPERFRLVLTGKGKAPDHVDERLAQLMLTNRVLRLPPVDFNDMLSYTVNADAGVLLYENNDLGNFFTAPGRMTEYLCCGLPLLGANRTGLENLILRYQLGITAEPSNPRLLADAILELDRRKTQGAYPAPRMRKLFEDHFAFDHWEPVVVDAFDKMLAGAPRRKKSSPPYPWMPSP
jgi:glycosyltransferase involved in cell wall biosynthesis